MALCLFLTPYLAPPTGLFNDQKHAARFSLLLFFPICFCYCKHILTMVSHDHCANQVVKKIQSVLETFYIF